MLNDSPLRPSFLLMAPTPTKALVSHDINGWMETHAKMPPPRLAPRFPKQPETHRNEPAERTNIALLRQRRASLMRNTARKMSEKLVPPTAVSSNASNSCKGSTGQTHCKGAALHLKAIQVSEFNLFEDQPETEAEVQLPPEIKPHNGHSRKIKGEFGEKLEMLRLKGFCSRVPSREGKLQRLLLGQSLESVQQKADHHYRGRNSINRKLLAFKIA